MEVKVILSLDEDFKVIANRLLTVLEVGKIEYLEASNPVAAIFKSLNNMPTQNVPTGELATPLEDEPKMEDYVPKHGAMEPAKEEIVEEDVACVDLGSLRESVKEIVVKLVQAKKKDKVVALCEKFGVKKTTDVPDGKLYEFLEELKSL